MTDFTPPSGWKFYGSNNGNQTTFTLPGHTVKAPRLAIFDRRVPVVSNGNVVSPMYRIRIIRGILDAEGNAHATKVVCEFSARWPLAASPVDVIADIVALAETLSDEDMQDDIVNEQLLPR